MKQETENRFAAQIREAERLAGQGRRGEALDLYGKALSQSRDTNLLHTAEQWLRDGAFLREAGEAAVCAFVIRAVSTVDACEPSRRETLQALCLEALERFDPAGCAVRQDTSDRYAAECVVLRHMGRQEQALEAARRGLREHGTACCATFAGLCCLKLGDTAGAEAYIRQGARMNPLNMSGCNDLGDYFFDGENYEKAEEYYSMVLESGDRADCGWAEPSALFCRWMRKKSPADLERLALCAAAAPNNSRAAALCGRARGMIQTPYVDYLPRSTEALVNCLRGMEERGMDAAEVRITLSCQEAASCVNALRLHMNGFGARQARLALLVERQPDPPLDETLIPEGVRLWNYGPDLDAAPSLPPPPEETRERVARLARRPFGLAAWYEKAEPLAKGLDAQSLYACMTYPPAPPEGLSADVWLMRVQYAAVCILARMGGGHIQARSERMKEYARTLPSPELARICFGQLDWPVIPALTLLAWQCKQGLAGEDVVGKIFFELTKRVAKKNFCFFQHALVCAIAWLPGLTEEIYEQARAQRKRLEAE